MRTCKETSFFLHLHIICGVVRARNLVQERIWRKQVNYCSWWVIMLITVQLPLFSIHAGCSFWFFSSFSCVPETVIKTLQLHLYSHFTIEKKLMTKGMHASSQPDKIFIFPCVFESSHQLIPRSAVGVAKAVPNTIVRISAASPVEKCFDLITSLEFPQSTIIPLNVFWQQFSSRLTTCKI